MPRATPLEQTCIVITRPAGAGATLARRIRALGGMPLLLPGSSLRPAADVSAARAALRTVLDADCAIFTSPAAVRFARRLLPLHGHAQLLAPGSGTLRALQRAAGTRANAPAREDSEGLLALPTLCDVRGQRIGIVGAPGGRGLLARELTARGASVLHANVYERHAARLDARHAAALAAQAGKPLYTLLSSSEALANILRALPAAARGAWLTGTTVVSSERLAEAARGAGFARVLRAESAHAEALLAAVIASRA